MYLHDRLFPLSTTYQIVVHMHVVESSMSRALRRRSLSCSASRAPLCTPLFLVCDISAGGGGGGTGDEGGTAAMLGLLWGQQGWVFDDGPYGAKDALTDCLPCGNASSLGTRATCAWRSRPTRPPRARRSSKGTASCDTDPSTHPLYVLISHTQAISTQSDRGINPCSYLNS